MRSVYPRCALLLIAILLAGCGRGGSDAGSAGAAAPARGTLLQTAPELLSTISASTLLLELNASPNQQLLSLSGTPVCDILMYDVRYETVGGANEPTAASAALLVPTGLGANCTGARPIVLYAHGTTADRTFNMANVQNTETLFLAALFAAKGYIVVAPNYAGYDASTLPYHPYLIADQQSKDMIDALAAARNALPLASGLLTKDGGQLFITGYSEGGYVAMATHRAMEAAGAKVTAAAPMSGPYALAAFVDAVFSGEVNRYAPVSSALLLTAYQKVYGDIYSSAADVFEDHYAADIDALLPSSTPIGQLYAQGKLPENALFSPTPPAPAYADITPPAAPPNLAEVFAMGFGPNDLIRNGYRLSYLQDAQSNPDGGWPAMTTGLAAANPGLTWRRALKLNDLRSWTPIAPVLLCAGDADPLVFWLNTALMQSYWTAHAPASAPIGVLDLESAAAVNDPYADLKNGFKAAKDLVAANAIAQGATDGGSLAVAEAYHTSLVAPYCFAAVVSFFATH